MDGSWLQSSLIVGHLVLSYKGGQCLRALWVRLFSDGVSPRQYIIRQIILFCGYIIIILL